MLNIAIVGFGCAGYQALRAIRSTGLPAQVTVFSDTGEPPANPMLTTYYAGGKIPRKNLFPFGSLEEIARDFDCRICPDSRVTALNAEDKTLTLADGTVCGPYDRILLATGASALVPPLGVSVGKRVLVMRTVEDAQLLRDRLAEENISSAIVVGGSMVGIKVAELLADRSIPCTLADMAPSIFPLSALPAVAEEIEGRIAARGVELKLGLGISGAVEREDGVCCTFSDGSEQSCGLLVLCIGTRAAAELAREAGLAVGRGIAVGENMETSVPGIYAAGDCCEANNLMTGQRQIIGLWANAGWQGQAAGLAMIGQPAAFSGNIVHNITHFMGMDFISIGDVKAQGRHVSVGHPSGRRYLEAVVDETGKPLCVNLLDSYHISGVIKNYMLNRFSGNDQPLPPEMRGLLYREGADEEFLSIFEGGVTQ